MVTIVDITKNIFLKNKLEEKFNPQKNPLASVWKEANLFIHFFIYHTANSITSNDRHFTPNRDTSGNQQITR